MGSRKSARNRQSKRSLKPPNLGCMDACMEDARIAALDNNPGPPEPIQYAQLRKRLTAIYDKLPPLYRAEVLDPFAHTLKELGSGGFAKVLARDPKREGEAGLMIDIAQAVLQHGEKYLDTATDAFQEVVSDLYDGFLSAEDRRGVNPPDLGTTPPLVKWGNPDFGPYTWPTDATRSFGLKAGIVNLPPANAGRSLLAWAALGHETSGHDILHADKGLPDELAGEIMKALDPMGHGLGEYWSERIDETASDVLGILNMGPAAGIGLVVYFRALNLAYGGDAVLRCEVPSDDPHPADIVRGYLAAETVSLLRFSSNRAWAKIIAAETDKDVREIVLAGEPLPASLARQSARRVAHVLVLHKARALEQHSIGEIQNWRDADERKVRDIRNALSKDETFDSSSGYYAAHAVAAGVLESLAGGMEVGTAFAATVSILKAMHDKNPSWGPLFVRHPGDLVRDRLYIPTAAGQGL